MSELQCHDGSGEKYFRQLLASQKDEITSYLLYKKVGEKLTNEHNRHLLLAIAADELQHYNYLKTYSGKDVKPSKLKMYIFMFLAKIFGLTFAFKYFEYGENKAINSYQEMLAAFSALKTFIEAEEKHEQAMLDILQERKLNYVGSIVLGLNDALVEFTSALAGYTFAMRESRLIGIIGLITGVAAALSMSSSEYFSQKNESDNDERSPLAASFYTGIAYITTVVLLVLPFFLLRNYLGALVITIFAAILIIFAFNFYIAIVKNYKFWPRFFTMAGISLGVAAVSFIIGIIIRMVFDVDV